jgi:glycosyltransferase involved in cell wall biosynthesis
LDIQVPLFCVRHGEAAGLESAVSNLVTGLAASGVSVKLPYSSSQRLNPEFLRSIEGSSNLSLERYPHIPGGMWTRFAEESIFLNIVKSRAPIIFPNYFLPPSLGRHGPLFVFIHDCQHKVYPQYFSIRKRMWLDMVFQHSLNRAQRVFLISEFERSQLARFYGESSVRNCTVVYNSIDWRRYTSGEVSDRIRAFSKGFFILSVSHQYPHKNTLLVIDAFLKLAQRFPGLHLALVGRPSAATTERIAAIADPAVRERIFPAGFIRDADLGCLYAACRAFVLPSEYEGFGMPAVEAMGFGASVIAAGGSSLPEVTLGLATYVDPGSRAEVWAEAIAQELDATRDPTRLAAAAAAVRAKYDPKSIAMRVLEHL